jgi:hypothetical protein
MSVRAPDTMRILGRHSADGRIILKRILEKQVSAVSNEFIWLKKGTG